MENTNNETDKTHPWENIPFVDHNTNQDNAQPMARCV